MSITKRKPFPRESSEYFRLYIDQVDTDDFLEALNNQLIASEKFYDALPDDKWNHTYGEGKWTIKEVLIHLMDTERILAYRALRVARNDKTPLPGFEQDDYIPFQNTEHRSVESLLKEYRYLRLSTIEFFKSLNEEACNRIGTASDNPISPRALGFIIAGHELHHQHIIRERYL